MQAHDIGLRTALFQYGHPDREALVFAFYGRLVDRACRTYTPNNIYSEKNTDMDKICVYVAINTIQNTIYIQHLSMRARPEWKYIVRWCVTCIFVSNVFDWIVNGNTRGHQVLRVLSLEMRTEYT